MDATTAVINPPIPELEAYKNRYNNIPRYSLARQSEPLTTIVEMLKRDSKQVCFACEAAITDFDTSRPWYSAKCSICNKRAHLQLLKQPSFECEDHFKKQESNIMYCVNGTIADKTASVKCVFFNESMTAMLNITYKELTLKRLNTDPNKTPPEMLAIRGISYPMNVTLKLDGTVIVNKASEPTTLSPNTPDPKTSKNKASEPTTLSPNTPDPKTSKNKNIHQPPDCKPPAKKIKY